MKHEDNQLFKKEGMMPGLNPMNRMQMQPGQMGGRRGLGQRRGGSMNMFGSAVQRSPGQGLRPKSSPNLMFQNRRLGQGLRGRQ